MRLNTIIFTALLGMALLAPGYAQESGNSDEIAPLTKEEIRWMDRMPDADRIASDRARGWKVPEFEKHAKWSGEPGPMLETLRGKVVLIQTFATRGSGRSAATRLNRSIKPFMDEEDFVAIAVHTPEDLDRIDVLLPKLKLEVPVMIDTDGSWCDQVGAFKRPVTYLVDRQGDVRYAGVSSRSLEDAVNKLLAEPYDQETPARVRAAAPKESTVGAQFPVSTENIGSATDRRQQRAPEFYVEEVWKQPVGDANGKVVILDFWATWCGPCREAIPHMNDIQNHYGDEVICLGISDESSFDRDMARRNLKASDFDYGLAVDTSSQLKGWFGVRGIPHVAVLSGDWVVRWQGHPSRLNKGTLDAIVNANRTLQMELGNMPDGPPPPRWRDFLEKQRG